jgi:hypothetical protein
MAAERRLDQALGQGRRVKYEVIQGALLELPLVWESDIRDIIAARRTAGTLDVLGLKRRERTPKPGHFLVKRDRK